MGYSVLVWNVEHFRAGANRTEKVDQLIEHFSPDIFGILEFQAKDVARKLASRYFTEYDFAFTDSTRAIEILVGWRRGKFDQIIYTQRREFQARDHNLRPGGLLSFRRKNHSVFDNILFLHTDSGRGEKDYKNRQTMFKKIWDMKDSIERLDIQDGATRFIAMGDLNTMGRKKLSTTKPSISAQDEIDKLTSDAQDSGMRILSKSHKKTWSTPSGSTRSNLDHVIASDDLSFEQKNIPEAEDNPFEVEVYGWNRLTGTAKRSFIENISDHCALYCKVV